MKTMKKAVAFLMALATAMSMTGVAFAEESSPARYDKLVIGSSADPKTLVPWDTGSGASGYAQKIIYESLFVYDGDDYVGILAKDYEVVDDYTYDVHLYDYIYDSEGNHITADDVVFSYDISIDSGYVNKFGMFESIEAIDDYTVRFHWNKVIDGVNELEHPFTRIFIVDEDCYNSRNFSDSPVGTGRYKVTNFVSGSSLTLEAVDQYWQTEELSLYDTNVQTLEIQVIAEGAQQVIALQNGTIDYSTAVPLESQSDFTEGDYADKYNLVSTPWEQCYMLLGNLSGSSVWSDINFRLACFYALNNEAIAAVTDRPVTKSLGSPYFLDHEDEWDTYENYITEYNVEKAKEYLAQSSYNGEELVLLSSSLEIYENMTTMVQSLLGAVGINVKIDLKDNATANALVSDPTAYDLYILNYAGGTQIGAWNRVFNNADFEDGLAMGFNGDEKLFELYALCNTLEGHTKENMTTFYNYIIDNAYQYPLTYGVNTIVYTKDIKELVWTLDKDDVDFGSCIYNVE